MKFYKEYRYALLSGVLIGTSYIPFPPWAVLFCMIPLWSQWLNLDIKKIFWTGWLTQFTLALIGFHWIPHSIIEYGKLPTFVGILGLLAFAALTNLHIPLAGVIWHLLKRKFNFSLNQSLFVIALLTAALEKINPQIFPWHFGYTWYFGDWPAYQLADLIGFSGISSLNYLLNAWILILFLNFKNKLFFKKQFVYFIFFFSIINIYGFYHVKKWKKTDSEFKALIVQPNIGNQDKQWQIYGDQSKFKTVDKHFSLTQPLINEQPDFILWPETSIPEFLNKEYFYNPNVRRVYEFADQNNVYLVTGAYTHSVSTNKQSNSIFVINPDGRDSDYYRKNILLPFGEYIPFSNLYPEVYDLFPTIGNFERGRGPHSIQVGNLRLGPQICYEGLHPWFSKGLIDDEAVAFVNVTNDSWFGHTFESYQHLYMTLARAVEFRRPMVRGTNTGISSVALASGEVLELSPQKQEWAKIIHVPYHRNPLTTFYSKFIYIDWVLVVLGLLLLLKLSHGSQKSRLE